MFSTRQIRLDCVLACKPEIPRFSRNDNYAGIAPTDWYTGSGSPSGNQYDLRSVATHELGHALGLWHTQPVPHCPGNSTDATMCASLPVGTTHWRSLVSDDRAGVAYLYP